MNAKRERYDMSRSRVEGTKHKDVNDVVKSRAGFFEFSQIMHLVEPREVL